MTGAERERLERRADHLHMLMSELDAELVEIEEALAADDGEDPRVTGGERLLLKCFAGCADQDVLTIVGRRACGCAVAAMVAGDPATTDYGELAKWKRSGLTLENRTVGWVRHTADEAGGIRTCPHRKRRRR